MRAEADPTLVRLKRLPVRLRLVHLAALLRHAREPDNLDPTTRGERSTTSDRSRGEGRVG